MLFVCRYVTDVRISPMYVFILTTYTFISMVFCILQSFTDPSAFILTQYPLKDTEVDLWRLCMDHDVHALVVLEENNQVLCSFK